MARKTAIRITNAELSAEEYRRDDLRDRIVARTLPTIDDMRRKRGGLPLAIRRADGALSMSQDSLLKRAQDAARLELRGDQFDPEDRADVAAGIVEYLLLELPERNAMILDTERVSLHRCCDLAKTLRRSKERERARDHAAYLESLDARAMSPEALGIERTPAKAARIMARSSVADAERATLAVLEMLGLDSDADSPAFAALYVWARDRDAEACAEERGVKWDTWRQRQSRGAKFIRNFYPLTELADALTLGASVRSDGILQIVTADMSREARGHAETWSGRKLRELAGQWREGTNAGNRPERPQSAEEARESCRVTRTRKRTPKLQGQDRDQHKADSMRVIASDYAKHARGKQRTHAKTTSGMYQDD